MFIESDEEMKLSHFSDTPIESVYSTPQPENAFFKPRGLWLSVDGKDDWAEWCEGESFRDMEEQYHYEIALRADANVLRLKSEQDLRDFHEKYRARTPITEVDEILAKLHMDWKVIAKDYQGLIIAPYIWSMRHDLKLMWYYAWDCASGCVWDADAIESLRLIRAPIKAKKKA